MYSRLIDLSPIANYFSYKVYIKVSTDYILTRLGRQRPHVWVL
jgi:hypothetical protein